MATSSSSICTIASAGTRSTIAKIVLAILLIQIHMVPSLVSASGTFDKDECVACVESCTYCKGSESEVYQDKPSVCVCGDITGGFYGGCDDYTFGGDALTSNRDCQSGSSNGGSTQTRNLIVYAAVGAFSILLIIAFMCCKHRQRGYGDKSNTIAGATTTNTFAPTNGGGTGGFGIDVASGGMFGGPSTTTGASAYTSAATGTGTGTGTGTLFGGNNGFNDINASSGFGDGHGGNGGFGDTGI